MIWPTVVPEALLLIGHLGTATYRSSRMQWRILGDMIHCSAQKSYLCLCRMPWRILGDMVHCGAQGTATCRPSRMQWRILGGMVHCGAQGTAT